MSAGALLALALCCVAPVFAGGMTPAGLLLIELSAFAAAAFAAAKSSNAGRRPSIVSASLCAIALLGILQWMPLPASLVEMLSPSTATIYRQAAALLQRAGAAAPASRISLAPEETLATLVFALACAAIVYAAAALPGKGVVEMFLTAGAIQMMASSFSVSNQDAAFLEMPFAAAVATARLSSGLRRRWSLIAALVFAGGIVASGSRGGMFAAAIAALFILLWDGSPRMTAATASAGAVALVVGALLAHDPRIDVWQHSVDAWRAFPIFGGGLGAFGDAFATVQPPQHGGIVGHAHNELLQVAVTCGVAGALLALIAAAAVLLAPFRRSPLGFAAAGATVALAVHGAVDFNFSVAAIPAAYLCLVGAGMGEITEGGGESLVEPIGIEPTTS